jgi:hypothetical protein
MRDATRSPRPRRRPRLHLRLLPGLAGGLRRLLLMR